MTDNHDEYRFTPPPRRKKQIPRWKLLLRKYWPTIRFGLIVLLLIAVIVVGIVAITSGRRLKNNGADETKAVETTQETVSQKEILAQAQELIIQADFIAAGYDYEKAITLLEEFEHFDAVPELAQKVADYREAESKLVPYANMANVTHIFFHSLIVDPSRAFDGEYTQAGYNQYMTTCDEFVAILEEMYNRGYVLVTPYQVAEEYTDSTGTHFRYCDLRLPEGKIPFIMSQDDLNYYGYMVGGASGVDETPIFANTKGDGFAHKIVIDENGYPTCEYMDKNGNVTTGDYDLVPLLEKFIQEHPDFAYKGARAVLGMTGYEGVFGYRTKPSYESAMGTAKYQQEVEEAKKVAQCLRDHGWVLASHSYGHPAYGNIPAANVERDSDKWENTVQPIIGNCDVILYPHGSDIAGGEKYTFDNAKFKALYEDGYRYFFNVDSNKYWSQLGDNYYRGGRRNLDGYRMWYHPHKLDDLFDVSKVFDPARPTPVPSI